MKIIKLSQWWRAKSILILQLVSVFLLVCTYTSFARDISNDVTSPSIQQQKRQVSGIVSDTKGDPVIGANIVEKGTTNGTVTDIDGHFSLMVESDAILQISFIGYLTQEVSTAGQNIINLTLHEDTQALDELVW